MRSPFQGPPEDNPKHFVPRSFYGVHVRPEVRRTLEAERKNLGSVQVGDYNDNPNLGLNTKDVSKEVRTVREALAGGIPPESTPK